MKITYFLLSIMLMIFTSIVTMPTLARHANAKRDKVAEYQCYENERKGYLKQGSCMCAAKIFTRWAESYDWMDACDILKARKK